MKWPVLRFEKKLKKAIKGMVYPSEGENQPLQFYKGCPPQGEQIDYEQFIYSRLHEHAWIELDDLMRRLGAVTVTRVADRAQVKYYVLGQRGCCMVGWTAETIET